MKNDTWERIEEIFDRVAAAPAAARAALLDQACGDDRTLRAEVESLLDHDTRAGERFLASPIVPPVADAAETPDWARAFIDRRIGRYTVVRPLGHGGMGCVFEARQERPTRSVALKVLQPGASAPSALARFRLEPEVLGRLQHPNIAQVYEAGVHDDTSGLLPYFAMEYIPDARPLIEHASARNLAGRERLELFCKVCDAVHHGHQKGIIHRDLKPANILVGADGEPKVIDFGVARASDADIVMTTQHTGLGDLIGTIRYMSPEQCEGNSAGIDVRSDIYSLGVVLYELLTGTTPYDTSGTTVYTAIRVIKDEPPRRPSSHVPLLRGDLDAILLKTLEKAPARRYVSAADLARDVRRHLGGMPIEARPPTLLYVAGRYARRHIWQTASAALGVVFLLVMLAAVAMRAEVRAAKTEADAAERAAYRGTLQSAEVALMVNDAAMARQHLARIVESQRGNWEWRHLEGRTDQSIVRYGLPQLGASLGGSALTRDGRLLARLSVSPLQICVSDCTTHEVVFRIAAEKLSALASGLPPKSQRGESSNLPDASTLALSPDGRTIAWSGYQSGGAAVVALFDVDSRSPEPTNAWCMPDAVTGLAFHPHRPILVGIVIASDVRGDHLSLIAWDLERAAPGASAPPVSARARVNAQSVAHLQFSPDGRFLAADDRYEYLVRLWSVDELLAANDSLSDIELRGHTYNVTNLAFSYDSQWIATGAANRTIRVWNLERCQAHVRDTGERAVEADAVDAELLFSPNGGIRCLEFDRTGSLLFAGDDDRLLHVWRRHTTKAGTRGDPVREWQYANTLRGHDHGVQDAFSLPDGDVLSVCQAGEVRRWAPFAEEIPRLRGHTTSVQSVACTPDGRHVVSGDGSFSIRIWDSATGEPKACIRPPLDEAPLDLATWVDGPSSHVAAAFAGLNPDGRAGGRIAVWSLADPGRPRLQFEYPASAAERGQAGFLSVAISGDGRRLAAGDQTERIHICELAPEATSATPRQTLRGGSERSRALFFRDAGGSDFTRALTFLDTAGRWLVSGAIAADHQSPPAGPALRLWDTQTGHAVAIALPDETPRGIYRLAVAPDRASLAAATTQGPIEIYSVSWRGDCPEVKFKARLEGHVGPVHGVQFHPTAPRLASCGMDRVARLWDIGSASEVVALHGAKSHLIDLAFDASGDRLFTTCCGNQGVDNTVLVWEAAPSTEVRVQRAQIAQRDAFVRPALATFNGFYTDAADFLDTRIRAEAWALPSGTPREINPLAYLSDEERGLEPVWRVVRQPGASDTELRKAQDQAAALCECWPWSPTARAALGATEYRLWLFPAAYATLSQARGLAIEFQEREDHVPPDESRPYFAMVCARLGRLDEARAARDLFRSTLDPRPDAVAPAHQRLLAEVERILGQH